MQSLIGNPYWLGMVLSSCFLPQDYKIKLDSFDLVEQWCSCCCWRCEGLIEKGSKNVLCKSCEKRG